MNREVSGESDVRLKSQQVVAARSGGRGRSREQKRVRGTERKEAVEGAIESSKERLRDREETRNDVGESVIDAWERARVGREVS